MMGAMNAENAWLLHWSMQPKAHWLKVALVHLLRDDQMGGCKGFWRIINPSGCVHSLVVLRLGHRWFLGICVFRSTHYCMLGAVPPVGSSRSSRRQLQLLLFSRGLKTLPLEVFRPLF